MNKILFLSHYSFLYGSNRSLDSLIDYFRLQGDHVEVLLTTKGEFYKHLVKKDVRVHSFFFVYEALYYKWNRKYLSLPLIWIYNLLTFPLLCHKVRSIGPDVIYTNSSADLFSIWVAKVLGVRHIVHVREFMEEDFGARCIFGRGIKRRILLRSDRIICVSHAVADSVLGEIPDNGKVIYNGLKDTTVQYNCPDLQSRLRIGVVGNLDISKQQGLAISYMPRILHFYPGAALHIIGDKECPYKRQIIKQVHDLGLTGNVVFEGFVKSVEEIYQKFDVLLMCSRSEAFGRVTIEAMLRKRPVIGYMSGGTAELIEHGVTGFIFQDVEDVLAALRALTGSREKLEEVAENARGRVKAAFSEYNYQKNVYDFVTIGQV